MIIITATGSDRPGMVAGISQTLFEIGCNIEDTTMTRLCGEFAMILVVTRPVNVSTQQLAAQLAPLESTLGLRIACSDFETGKSAAENESPQHFMLSVYGPDKTGLVARFSQILAEYSVNITDLQTRVAAAHTVYVMLFELELPSSLDAATLQDALDAAAAELDVNLSLNALDEDAL
jgi:glycine cleavage system transcriptional repressor